MFSTRFLPLLAAGLIGLPALAGAAQPVVEVYKTAECGCCKGWVKHLEKHGFAVKTHDVPNPGDYREKFGIPNALGSCHTGRVGGYALEGHVPAADIRRLLASKPVATGLAVPAMPLGSPGMEGPRSDPYDVLLVTKDGKTTVFKRYE